jgi:hypothetical protein
MKKRLLLILLFPVINTTAQTKVIAHKSHSGNSHNFSKAYQHNLFDMRSSNFGEAPQPEIKRARLDSVIFVNDTCQIMVTTETCTDRFGGNAITKDWNTTTNSWQKALEVSKDKKTSVWKAGRDTVYNHYLFAHHESLEWIKERIKKDFYFANSIDSTVFEGYNNAKPYEEVNPFIKVNKFYNNTLEIHINGIFRSNCAMGYYSGYDVIWGIEYQKSNNEKWEIVLPFERATKACGLPYEKYLDTSLSMNLLYYWKRCDSKIIEIPKGKYKLFAVNNKTKERVYSNEFEVK